MAPHSSKSIYNTPEHSLLMKTVVMAKITIVKVTVVMEI